MCSFLVDQLLLCLVCVAAMLSLCSAQEEAVLDFDCRRLGASCHSGVCDVTTGECAGCVGVDYQCRDGENNCPQSYYGVGCALNRVQVDCDSTSMFLNVNPDVTSFSGTIFLIGSEGLNDCHLNDGMDVASMGDFVQNKASLQGFQIQLPHTGGVCGDAAQEDVSLNSSSYRSISRQFMVRYSADYVTLLDQVVTAECRIVEGSTQVYSGSTVVNQTDEEFRGVDASSSVDTVSLSVRRGDGSSISAPVKLGADIQLVFTLAPSSGFLDFNIKGCTANNTDPNEATVKTLEFIQNQCPTVGSYSLFKSSLTKFEAASAGDPVEIRINMKAFLFLGNYQQVAFVCDIVLCENTGEAQCSMSSCNGVTASENATISEPTNNPTETPVNATDTQETTQNNSTTETNLNNSNSTVSTSENPTNNATISQANINDTSASNATAGSEMSPLTNLTESVNTTDSSNLNTEPAGNNEDTALSRRRRAAQGDTEQVGTVITVYDPMAFKEEAIDQLRADLASRDCLNQPEILACIAVLSAAVILLLAVTTALTFNLFRYREKDMTTHDEPKADYSFRMPRPQRIQPFNN